MQKLRIGVLMGGKSIEREVSFNSGRTICDHLDTNRYTICPLFQRSNGTLYILPWHFLHRGKISDFEHRLEKEATTITWDALKDHVDFMYLAMHGRFAEDGTLQGMLEVVGIPYLGSKVLASALGMDKDVQKEVLQAHSISVPHSITLTPHEIYYYHTHQEALMQLLEQAHLSLPLVIKPCLEGSSLGVCITQDPAMLMQALLNACNAHPDTYQKVIVQEMIDGMEFSCISIMDQHTREWIALPPTEIIPEHGSQLYDYEQKYMPGRAFKHTPARCSDSITHAIQQTCIAVSKALNFATLSRIDGFATPDGRIVIIDPNSLSGMAPSSYLFNQAAHIGMNHTDLINYLIATELHAYGMADISMHTPHTTQPLPAPDRLRVAVLLGGDTGEREISLESGRNITYKLSPQKYKAIPLFVDENMHLYQLDYTQLVCGSTKEIQTTLQESTRIAWSDLARIADFVFIALHGGRGENGSVQGTLEMLGIPYNGSSVLASALCMDKYRCAQYLKQKGFSTPKQLLIDSSDWHACKNAIIEQILGDIKLPCIVKPHDDGCSIMVSKVIHQDTLSSTLDEFFATGRKQALVEEFIHGMELTVGVLGNDNPQALPPSKAVACADILSIEEKFLPGAGENLTPAPLAAHDLAYVQETVARAYQSLGCKGYARIDCFFQSSDVEDKKRVIILEVNSLPGMTPATCIFHQAAEVGMRPMDFVDQIVTLGLEEHTQKKAGKSTHCPQVRTEIRV